LFICEVWRNPPPTTPSPLTNHGFEDRKGIKVKVLVKQYIKNPSPRNRNIEGGRGAFSKLVKICPRRVFFLFWLRTQVDLFPPGKNSRIRAWMLFARLIAPSHSADSNQISILYISLNTHYVILSTFELIRNYWNDLCIKWILALRVIGPIGMLASKQAILVINNDDFKAKEKSKYWKYWEALGFISRWN
jgi:hypothetical protein